MKILHIYFRKNIKDSIIDCLLDDEFDSFYCFPCLQYNTKLLVSAKERVSGRIDYWKVELFVNDEQESRICNKLHAMYGADFVQIISSDFKQK